MTRSECRKHKRRKSIFGPWTNIVEVEVELWAYVATIVEDRWTTDVPKKT